MLSAVEYTNVDYFLNLPANVFWLDRDNYYQGINEKCFELVELDSLKAVVGMTDYDLSRLGHWDDGVAEFFRKSNSDVISSGFPKHNIEEPAIKDEKGSSRYYITSRIPMHDDKRNIVGVLGISFDVTEKRLLAKNPLLKQIALAVQPNIEYKPVDFVLPDTKQKVHLTKKEALCLYHILQGKSAREIAKIFFRSKRTIETHIENIKNKFRVNTKSELCELVYMNR